MGRSGRRDVCGTQGRGGRRRIACSPTRGTRTPRACSALRRGVAGGNYRDGPLREIPGNIMSAAGETGCAFAPRCNHALAACRAVAPPGIRRASADGHGASHAPGAQPGGGRGRLLAVSDLRGPLENAARGLLRAVDGVSFARRARRERRAGRQIRLRQDHARPCHPVVLLRSTSGSVALRRRGDRRTCRTARARRSGGACR